MSTAKGMWYQSESKLKMPRSSASLVVNPQCATTSPITPPVTARASQDAPRGGGVAGGVDPEVALAPAGGVGSPAAAGPAGREPRDRHAVPAASSRAAPTRA